jgi:hypothetical protein
MGSMNTSAMTLQEIRCSGLEALSRELGPYRMVRFLQQFQAGKGDYTQERHQWLGNQTVRDVAQEIRHED